MYTGDGADEVAVRHVCYGGEVGFVAAGGGDVPACLHPLPAFLSVRLIGVV